MSRKSYATIAKNRTAAAWFQQTIGPAALFFEEI